MDTTDYRPDTEDMQSRELDIIASTRAEVMGAPREASTMNPFLIWGYPSAFFLFLEFVALLLWHKNWCAWLWVGIPLVAGPLMAYALHQDGWQYTDENIDRLLAERHMAKKARRASHRNHLKGPRKRTEEDDARFAESLERLLASIDGK